MFFALFRLFPARLPRTHQTAQAEQADADAGQQVGQGQHTAGGLKQGLGQLQPGAEQERARLSTLIARMDAAGEGDQVARLQDPEFVQEMLKKMICKSFCEEAGP